MKKQIFILLLFLDKSGLFNTAAKKLNQFLERFMPLLLSMGVVLGVFKPGVFIVFRPYIPLFFGAMTFTGALKLKLRELGKAASSPRPVILFFMSAHVLMPVLVFFISRLVFKNDADTVSGYVLLYSAPTAVSGFIWVSIYGGDPALSMALILIDSILAPVVLPGTARILLRTGVSFNMTGMALSLVFMVVIPTILGLSVNEFSRGKISAIIGPGLAPLSKICLFTVVAANSAAVAPQINPDNPRLWIIIIVCVCFGIFNFCLAKLTSLAGKLKPEKQTALFLAAGLRNTSAAMTLAIDYFPGPAALPPVLGIMFQHILAALMGRLLIRKSVSP